MTEKIAQYNRIAKVVHWVSAITIFAMFAIGYWMVDLTYYSEWYKIAPHWHKSVGLTLFVLSLFRLFWKWIKQAPKIEGKKWEKMGAKIVHALLYVLLFSTFISGYLISTADGRGIEFFNFFTLPGMGSFIQNQEDIAGDIHFYLTYTLIGFALLHALAAFKHHFINKDNTLRKII